SAALWADCSTNEGLQEVVGLSAGWLGAGRGGGAEGFFRHPPANIAAPTITTAHVDTPLACVPNRMVVL
ncbi:MAG: hypothetical protein QF792_01550, partial [Phycisphaerae bacterium]|nr:hypothetical protein [Phycisphaerae bacterium]